MSNITYTRTLVLNILQYREEIRALLERSTGHPQASVYQVPGQPPMQEHKTLMDYSPRTTRVTATHTLRDQLLDMMVDVDMARKCLSEYENACLAITYILRPIGRPNREIKQTAEEALEKVLCKINGVEEYEQQPLHSY